MTFQGFPFLSLDLLNPNPERRLVLFAYFNGCTTLGFFCNF
jgi:hypothetical protein